MGFHYPYAVKHSLATAANDFIVASGAGVFVKKTLAEVKTLLGLGTAAYTAATDYVTHALATAANDFLVASGSGAYVKKTLAETLAILAHSIASHSDTTATGAELEELTDGSETTLHSHVYGSLLVVVFQLIPATGTMGNPERLNDNNTGTDAMAAPVGEYGEIVLPSLLKITQWRQYGNTGNHGDGVWKIQYMNIDGNLVDWVTGISTRDLASWSSWDSSGGEVIAMAIRLVCTTLDGAGGSYINGLEVKY